MGNGYPMNYRSTVATRSGGARVATAASGMGRISLKTLAKVPLSFPRIPPPHPGILAALGVAVAVGYGLQYYGAYRREKDFADKATNQKPGERTPPFALQPFRYIPPKAVHPQDAWIDGGTAWKVPGVTKKSGDTNYHWARQGPTFRTQTGWLWKNDSREQKHWGTRDGITPTGLQYWAHTATYPPRTPPVPPMPTPGYTIGGFPGWGWPGSTSGTDGVGGTTDGTANPPGYTTGVRPKVDARNGIAFDSKGISIANTMTPYPNEVKSQASAQTMRVIQRTVGELGEAIDFTRCFMYATGNTYLGNDGKERVIPKSQWDRALWQLSDAQWNKQIELHGSGKNSRWSHSKWRGNSLVKADGTILNGEQVGQRLAECLVLNWFQDLAAAKQSQVISALGAQSGLTLGPLNVQSLVTLLGGEVPYEGMLDLHL